MAVDWTKYNEVSGQGEMWQKKDTPLKIGDSIEGRYMGSESHQGPKKNSMIHKLEQADGSIIGVWGTAVLDSRFSAIAIGKMVAIEYIGKEKSKNGDEYNNFKVGVGIDVPGDESPY